jgi:aminoglycoside phosphotransferase (APT) family kinase protein
LYSTTRQTPKRADAATAAWEAALAASWHDPPVWFHGDVAAGNLLVEGGRLSAVIDFGTSGVGDPSCDVAIAWTLSWRGITEHAAASTYSFRKSQLVASAVEPTFLG